MKQIEQIIFPLVKTHFPDFYQDEGPRFVDFVKEYYRWMNSEGEALNASRNLLDYRNIDTTSQEFVKYFKNKYFLGIPITSESNTQFLIKHASDIYKSKGTPRGVQLVLQGLFNQESKVYFPGDDLLKTSDGTWVKPVYLELSVTERTKQFVGKEIIGSQSGAKAFLESLVRRRINGKFQEVGYLSNVRGTFQVGEFVTSTADTNLANAPSIIGSMSNLTVVTGGANFAVGDIFDVISSNGKQGKARVTEVSNETGRVTFIYIDALTSGGWGYSLAHANVIISSKVLTLTNILNSNTKITTFSRFERVQQPLINIAYSTARANNFYFEPGNVVENFNSNGTANAEAIIVTSSKTTSTTGYIVVSPVSGNIAAVDTTFAVRAANAANASFNASLVGVSFNTFTGTSYTSSYTGVYSGDFNVSYTNAFTGTFTDLFTGVYTTSWTRVIGTNIYTRATTANWTSAFTGAYSSSYNSGATTSFSSVFVGHYVSDPYSGQVFTGGSFTGSFTQLGYVGTYGSSAVYTSLPGPGVTTFTGGFVGAYTDTYTSVFSGTYTSTYTDTYVSSWIAGFTGVYSPVFTGGFSGNYALGFSKVYTGTYTGGFSSSFTTAYTKTFTNNFTGVYNSSFALAYTGTYTNATRINTTAPHPFSNGDLVRYEVLTGNTAISQLSSGAAYYVVNAISGSTSLSLANTVGGSALTLTAGSNETGHKLTKTLGSAVITSFADRTASGNVVGSNVAFLTHNFNSLTGVANVTDIITTTSPHEFQNNQIIRYTVSQGNTAVGGLTVDGEYYIVNTSLSSLQLALTREGSPINLTSGVNEVGHFLTQETGFLGVTDLSANGFLVTPHANVVGLTTNTHATVANVSTGTGANFEIGTLTDTESVFLSPDFLSSNNTGNVVFHSVKLDGSNANASGGFGFVKYPGATINTILLDALRFDATTIGSIAAITSINPGQDYNVDPFVAVVDTYVSGYDRHDYVMKISNLVGSFTVGEQIQQTYDSPATQLTVNTFSGTYANGTSSTTFVLGEFVYQSNSTTNVAASGYVLEAGISAGAGSLKLANVTGTFVTTTNSTTLLKGLSSGSTSNVSAVSLTTYATTARAFVKEGSNTSSLLLKRINLENTFLASSSIIGRSSGATANVVNVDQDTSTLAIGLNANIVANVQTANNTVKNLSVYDSGFGYIDNETVTLSKEDSNFTVTAIVNIQKQGIGAGFYSSTKGFLDSDKKLQDNEYYQEYSYEVQTKIPFDKYFDVLKQVTHVAGTKAFGKVNSLSLVNASMTVINSIEIS